MTHRDPEELLARLSQLLRDALAVDNVVTFLAQGDRLFPANATETWPALTAAGVTGSFPSSEEAALRRPGFGTVSRSSVTAG